MDEVQKAGGASKAVGDVAKTAEQERADADEVFADAINIVRDRMLRRIKGTRSPLSIRKKCLVVVDQLDAIAAYDQKASLESVRAELDQQAAKQERKQKA